MARKLTGSCGAERREGPELAQSPLFFMETFKQGIPSRQPISLSGVVNVVRGNVRPERDASAGNPNRFGELCE